MIVLLDSMMWVSLTARYVIIIVRHVSEHTIAAQVAQGLVGMPGLMIILVHAYQDTLKYISLTANNVRFSA